MSTPLDTRYNQVRQKASHNSYERDEGLDDQIVYWRLRALELDLHNGKSCSGRPGLPRDWYVYHFCGPGGTGTTVDKLSAALDELVGIRSAIPQHEVMTVFLDLKDDWNSDHSPNDLDALLVAKMGRGRLWTPADLVGTSGLSLQRAIQQNGWPTLGSLRGRWIFVLTGGDVKSAGAVLNKYVDEGRRAASRIAFVAPGIGSASDIGARDYVVYFNHDASEGNLARAVFDSGFVTRMYDVNSSGSWNSAVASKVHVIATNKVNSLADPWARTDNARGWPFQGIDVSVDATATEAGAIYGILVGSGDIWDKKDSFTFAYADTSTTPDRVYNCFVSSPASHVEGWTKGGVLARASLDADAAYFGVFRTGTKNLRVQYRKKRGDSTTAKEVDLMPSDTVDENNLIYVRLQISNNGKRGAAWGSLDGWRWTPIAQADFSDTLRFQGWGASSHGDDRVKFLFGFVGGGPAYFPLRRAIGSGVRVGQFFTGVYP